MFTRLLCVCVILTIILCCLLYLYIDGDGCSYVIVVLTENKFYDMSDIYAGEDSTCVFGIPPTLSPTQIPTIPSLLPTQSPTVNMTTTIMPQVINTTTYESQPSGLPSNNPTYAQAWTNTETIAIMTDLNTSDHVYNQSITGTVAVVVLNETNITSGNNKNNKKTDSVNFSANLMDMILIIISVFLGCVVITLSILTIKNKKSQENFENNRKTNTNVNKLISTDSDIDLIQLQMKTNQNSLYLNSCSPTGTNDVDMDGMNDDKYSLNLDNIINNINSTKLINNYKTDSTVISRDEGEINVNVDNVDVDMDLDIDLDIIEDMIYPKERSNATDGYVTSNKEKYVQTQFETTLTGKSGRDKSRTGHRYTKRTTRSAGSRGNNKQNEKNNNDMYTRYPAGTDANVNGYGGKSDINIDDEQDINIDRLEISQVSAKSKISAAKLGKCEEIGQTVREQTSAGSDGTTRDNNDHTVGVVVSSTGGGTGNSNRYDHDTADCDNDHAVGGNINDIKVDVKNAYVLNVDLGGKVKVENKYTNKDELEPFETQNNHDIGEKSDVKIDDQ